MRLQASQQLNMEVPLAVYQASLYTGKSSAQFLSINKRRTHINLMLPFSDDPTKKALFQKISGKFVYDKNGVNWKESSISRIIQYDINSNPGKSKKQWDASKFSLKGKDVTKIAKKFKSWYSTPDDYVKYESALKDTQKLILKFFLGKDDTIIGSNSDDTLIGGKGRDSITGRQGEDTMYGGPGADTFHYNSIKDSWILKRRANTIDSATRGDFIADFNGAKGDKINLEKLGELTYIGKSDFSGLGGEVRFGMNNNLQVDTGDKKFLMNILLPSQKSFSADYLELA